MAVTDRIEFWAEYTRKSSNRLSGSVLMVDRAHRNGLHVLAIASPKGKPAGFPVPTWVAIDYLTDYAVRVTEAEARKIHPNLFMVVDAFERDASFRARYRTELQKPERTPMQIAMVP